MAALDHVVFETSGRPLLVGFSGGLDSSVLLHLIAGSPESSQREVRAIHVHHGLDPGADGWAAHCQKSCDRLGIALVVVRVDVDRKSGDGMEAAARKVRHAAFEAMLRDDEILVLAHHRDDQAETFLLRALRSSGPDGLGAMRPWRRFGHAWLWRPLLATPRARLLAHAQAHGLEWIDDPGNIDTAPDRNFLRHHVLPLLRERWPHTDAALSRSAMLSSQASELLADEDAQALDFVREADAHCLEVERLGTLPAPRRARVLRRWIGELQLPPLPTQGITRIEADLLSAAADTHAEFAWSGAVIRRWRNVLHADFGRPRLPPAWWTEWDGREPLQLPGDGVLRLSGHHAFDVPILARARQGGERIVLPGRSHSHSIKHVLQDRGVPPWQRDRLPLLSTLDGELLAVADVVYSARFDAWLRERNARLIWSRA